MVSFLKVLEENVLDVIVILKKGVDQDFIDKVFVQTTTFLASKGKRGIIFHVFTDLDRPLYIEYFRSVLQKNISYTITLRYYNLSNEKLKEFLDHMISEKRELIVFAPQRETDLVKEIESLGIKVYTV
ncbi:MAG: hypothetical protein B6U89_02810 [Desulfurococcales archaeon ex4484_58]|nr:MAG: hypothetical protein B6U89_02810 [Desulfurococcales archaeon ex4484_58]